MEEQLKLISSKIDIMTDILGKLTLKIEEIETSNLVTNEKINKLEEKLENIDKDTRDILEGTGKMTDHLNVVNTIYDTVRKPITNITKMFLGKDSQLVLPDRKAIEYKEDKIEDITHLEEEN
jgi:hypothetical protein